VDLLRLDVAIEDVSRAFDEYNFSEARRRCIASSWGEFCDWYLEASKAALGSPIGCRQKATPGISRRLRREDKHARRDGLRARAHAALVHPFLPFITEELWHGLGFNADCRGAGDETIMYARWPKAARR
jgi:valyl-tRNA synthetase